MFCTQVPCQSLCKATCQGDEKGVLHVNDFVFLIRQNDLGALGSQDVAEIVRVSDAPCDSQNEVLVQFKLTKHKQI